MTGGVGKNINILKAGHVDGGTGVGKDGSGGMGGCGPETDNGGMYCYQYLTACSC